MKINKKIFEIEEKKTCKEMKLNHNLEVLSSLKHSINEKSINDVKILVGKEKKEFYASSFLLAARSSVFRTIFFPSNSIDQTKQLELKDILPNNFLDFLNYLNTGEIELNGQVSFRFKIHLILILKIYPHKERL